jgi:hypothetical protein
VLIRGRKISMLDLAIVIVNYNVRDLLRDCLKSVYASAGVTPGGPLTFDVCVVDNPRPTTAPAWGARISASSSHSQPREYRLCGGQQSGVEVFRVQQSVISG